MGLFRKVLFFVVDGVPVHTRRSGVTRVKVAELHVAGLQEKSLSGLFHHPLQHDRRAQIRGESQSI